jgi:tetratricopeptide (TPR) repeat protein
MSLFPKSASAVLLAFAAVVACAQTSSKTPPGDSTTAAEHGAKLAESGRCSEALPLLAKSVAQTRDKDLQKRVAVDGVRCANLLRQPDQVLEFARVLNRQFPLDPEVLYVLIHAYSDLSSESARELASTAPTSIPSLELDAETNEMQGKWDDAEKDYHKILQQNPKYQGIHFRLARIQLSKPNPGPDFKEIAKKELQEELAIDPFNAGAEYILGELARQASDFPEAIGRFTKATELDHSFADAYLGLGVCLLTEKKYADAIPPLETAVKLQPTNPLGHYNLATAYARTGRKEDAERQFALHKQMSERAAAPGAQPPQ